MYGLVVQSCRSECKNILLVNGFWLSVWTFWESISSTFVQQSIFSLPDHIHATRNFLYQALTACLQTYISLCMCMYILLFTPNIHVHVTRSTCLQIKINSSAKDCHLCYYWDRFSCQHNAITFSIIAED